MTRCCNDVGTTHQQKSLKAVIQSFGSVKDFAANREQRKRKRRNVVLCIYFTFFSLAEGMFRRVQYCQSLDLQFRRLKVGGLIMSRDKARVRQSDRRHSWLSLRQHAYC